MQDDPPAFVCRDATSNGGRALTEQQNEAAKLAASPFPSPNPDEQVWKRSKRDKLANFIPADVRHLGRTLAGTLRQMQTEQTILRSFFDHAGLPL